LVALPHLAAPGLALGNHLRQGKAIVRIIDAVGGIGAQVQDFMARAFKQFRHAVFQLKTGMVGGKGDDFITLGHGQNSIWRSY